MLSILHLIWDSWNVAHIARHKVTPDEAEEVCQSNPLVQEGKKGRLLIIGFTKMRRILTVILDREGEGIYYPVTARPSSKREKKIYKDEKEVLKG